jgi:putative transposase
LITDLDWPLRVSVRPEEGRTDEARKVTEEQIIEVLKEHEAGAKTAYFARKHGISEATANSWKAKLGGMDVSEARRLRALEAKLKKLLAEHSMRPPPDKVDRSS